MSSKSPQSDYEQALALKDAGNSAFKLGDFQGALKNYSRIFMHIGMNPCMNMSQMMGQQPNSGASTGSKDPLQQKTDELRLTAFNNMAAVYAKMNKWEDCKEKCSRVLKHDEKNTKALFRRGMANRKLNLYELARADLEKAKEFLDGQSDAAIERELKLLEKDEKDADKIFYAKMKQQMQKAQKRQQKKKQAKAEQKVKKQQEEQVKQEELSKQDNNPNIKANIKDKDNDFVWDIPQNDGNNNLNNNTRNNNNDSTQNDDAKNQGKDSDVANKQNDSHLKEQPSEF